MIIVKLLTKKRQLVRRLQEVDLGPTERAEDEAVLAKIDTALDLLEPAIIRQKQQIEIKAVLRRGRAAGEQKFYSRDGRKRTDPKHALALVRWRQKIRRNG